MQHALYKPLNVAICCLQLKLSHYNHMTFNHNINNPVSFKFENTLFCVISKHRLYNQIQQWRWSLNSKVIHLSLPLPLEKHHGCPGWFSGENRQWSGLHRNQFESALCAPAVCGSRDNYGMENYGCLSRSSLLSSLYPDWFTFGGISGDC